MTKPLRLYSNSSLSDYADCPRMFFYRYIMEWKPQTKGLPLIFGGCWHRAMDSVWYDLLTPGMPGQLGTVAERAYNAFLEEWLSAGMPAPEDMSMDQANEFGPRQPMHAQEMLYGYIQTRAAELTKMELVDIERPFAVPLDPEDEKIFYVGKIDKIVRYRPRNKLLGIEHKTTTAYRKGNNPFSSAFTESFSPNFQVDGYLYALHMFYPGEVGGVWVDGSLVHKSEEGFAFIPIEKQFQQLDMWLWEARSLIDQVEANITAYEQVDTSDRYMAAFPRRTKNCISYQHTCAYINMCRAWANPKGKPIPPGFQHEKWDPMEHLNRGRLASIIGEKDVNS